jgi:predicted DNA-binding transcriptional regulator AlpA
MAARENRGPTLAQIRRWPPTVNVEDAASAVGCSRSSAYAAIAAGTFPVKSITVGRRVRILTADLLRLLEGSKEPAA